jgi:hypothetical protein
MVINPKTLPTSCQQTLPKPCQGSSGSSCGKTSKVVTAVVNTGATNSSTSDPTATATPYDCAKVGGYEGDDSKLKAGLSGQLGWVDKVTMAISHLTGQTDGVLTVVGNNTNCQALMAAVMKNGMAK